jgi:hypothetical protein
MRPSAAQLLQHERLELVFKVAETEKMYVFLPSLLPITFHSFPNNDVNTYSRLATVKSHKSTVISKESEVLARESALIEKEQHLAALLAQKDAQINELQQLLSQLQSQPHLGQSDHQMINTQIAEAVARREEELRVLVTKREDEVAKAMARREEEIMDAVRKREEEVLGAWRAREGDIRKEVEARVNEVGLFSYTRN